MTKGVVKNVRMGDPSIHPAIRFDRFVRDHDSTYQTAKQPVEDTYVRTFPLYGSLRPSPAFTGVSRVTRFNAEAMDMSNLPPPWNDMRGDNREGSYTFNPTSEVDPEFFKILGNQSLMLPSERREEAKAFKAGWDQYQQTRKEFAEYTRRRRTLTRHHKSGIVGIDGPMKSDSELYAYERERVRLQAEKAADHADKRREFLAQKMRSADATAHRGWADDPNLVRGADVPLQRKCVEPMEHPFRFLDTHERLFPKFTPTFDPERANILRHHEVREKKHDILHHGSNHISGIRVRVTDEGASNRHVATAAELGLGIGWRTG